eukprot:238273-Chlamydomonas_euryale.AAC.1
MDGRKRATCCTGVCVVTTSMAANVNAARPAGIFFRSFSGCGCGGCGGCGCGGGGGGASGGCGCGGCGGYSCGGCDGCVMVEGSRG